MRKNIFYRVRGYLAAGLALIACPCHLVVTLPLLLSLTAGTGMGVYLKQNTGLVVVVSIIVFIGGLVLAMRWLGSGVSKGAANSTRQSGTQMNRPTHPPFLQQEKGGKEL
jgi:FtsH-binding integral membrane protein